MPNLRAYQPGRGNRAVQEMPILLWPHHRPQGERDSRRTIFGLRVNRWRRLSLILLPMAALVVWSLWDFLDLAPNPPRATTNVEASLMPQMWPQARRTPQNTGFVAQQAPVPQMVK